MKRDWHKNPGNYQPDDRDIIPAWFLSFLVLILFYLIFSCFMWGNTAGELELEKAKSRTYHSFDDYQEFVEQNK